jgi:DNA gyrase/topoisomerase IV subunit A
MNVLIDGRVPKVCSLKEVLRAFLDHRREVLVRRSNTGWTRSTPAGGAGRLYHRLPEP